MNIVGRLEAFLFRQKAAPVFFFLAAIAFLKTGIWFVPSLQRIAERPPAEQISFSATIISLLGANTIYEFFFVYFGFTLLFLALVALSIRRLPARNRLVSFIIFLCFPVSYTSLFWVGPDSFLLVLLLLLILLREQWLPRFVTSVLIGLEHFEVGLFAISGLVLASVALAKEWKKRKRYQQFELVAIGGLVVGKILASLFLRIGENSQSRASWWLANWGEILTDLFLRHHIILWGTLGVGWFVFAKVLDNKLLARQVFLGLSPAFLLLLVVEDQTRIFALVSAPILFHYLVFNDSFLKSISNRFAALVLIAWGIIPSIWVWGGYPKWGVLSYDLSLILDLIWPFLDLPISAHWPFI